MEVVLEEGGGEATVKFAKGGDAAVALRSMDGRDALSVVACRGEIARREERAQPFGEAIA